MNATLKYFKSEKKKKKKCQSHLISKFRLLIQKLYYKEDVSQH